MRQPGTLPTSANAVILSPTAPVGQPSTLPIPSRVYTSILPGSPYTGTQTILGSTDLPSNTGIWCLTIDGVVVQIVEGESQFSYKWDTTALQGSGNHSIALYAGAAAEGLEGVWAGGSQTINFYQYPGTAVHFAGLSTTYCQISDAAFNDTSAFTVAFWVNLDVSGFSGCVPVAHFDDTHFGWSVFIDSTPQVYLQVLNTGAGGGNSPKQNIGLGAWHFVVAGIDGLGNLFVSLDGANYVSNAPAGATPYSGTHIFNIGSLNNAGNHVKGAMDSVARWGRHLSQSEVGLLWNGSVGLNYHDVSTNPALSALLTGLTWWGDCDDQDGANLADATGSGRTLLGQNSTSTYTSVSGVR